MGTYLNVSLVVPAQSERVRSLSCLQFLPTAFSAVDVNSLQFVRCRVVSFVQPCRACSRVLIWTKVHLIREFEVNKCEPSSENADSNTQAHCCVSFFGCVNITSRRWF